MASIATTTNSGLSWRRVCRNRSISGATLAHLRRRLCIAAARGDPIVAPRRAGAGRQRSTVAQHDGERAMVRRPHAALVERAADRVADVADRSGRAGKFGLRGDGRARHGAACFAQPWIQPVTMHTPSRFSMSRMAPRTAIPDLPPRESRSAQCAFVATGRSHVGHRQGFDVGAHPRTAISATTSMGRAS